MSLQLALLVFPLAQAIFHTRIPRLPQLRFASIKHPNRPLPPRSICPHSIQITISPPSERTHPIVSSRARGDRIIVVDIVESGVETSIQHENEIASIGNELFFVSVHAGDWLQAIEMTKVVREVCVAAAGEDVVFRCGEDGHRGWVDGVVVDTCFREDD